jgi:hypothetical protein
MYNARFMAAASAKPAGALWHREDERHVRPGTDCPIAERIFEHNPALSGRPDH